MQKDMIQGYRLSPQQRRVWSLQNYDGASCYVTQCAVMIEGDFNSDILRAALQDVVNRHEILRTSFPFLSGTTLPLQAVNYGDGLEVTEHDLFDLTALEQKARIADILREERESSFDLEQSCLMRARIILLSRGSQILTVTLPSLCMDVAGLTHLVSEIGRSYEARFSGEQISNEAIQYADLAEILNELAESSSSLPGRDYWRKSDLSALNGLKLSCEPEQVANMTFEPRQITAAVDPGLFAEMRNSSREADAQVSTFALACWAALLCRLTEREDVTVGVAYDGRKYEELKQLLGLFARYLPIDCRMTADGSFSEILEGIKAVTSEAFKWQEAFSWDQTAGADEQGFFPYCFEAIEKPGNRSAANLLLSVSKQYSCIERFKIKLVAVLDENSCEIEFHYDANIFRERDIQDLNDRFMALLESATRNTSNRIDCLNILSDAERHQMLYEWNDTDADYSADQAIHHLFERQAESLPDQIAIVCEQQRLTYSELDERANQLANYLREKGTGPEKIVAVCMDRSADSIVSMLAILKAGGAYLHLDPSLPASRIEFILEDAGASLIITEQRFADRFELNIAALVCIDSEWAEIAERNPVSPSVAVDKQNPVYVIYTSGSTGKPKGVIVEHQQLINYVKALNNILGLEGRANYATVTTMAADLGNTVIYTSLTSGGTLHIISEERAADPQEMQEYISREEIDCLKIVPSHLRALMKSEGADKVVSGRRLVLGGESCDWELIEKVMQANSSCRVINHYGPTETTVGVLTCETREHYAAREKRAVPLGRPIANIQAYILNQDFEPVGKGEKGELYIGGRGLSRGYINRPDLTADRFIPNPFSQQPGQRLYKTGDLGRFLHDGNIEFLGRLDHQVKIRGFRIELSEIEAALALHPSIAQPLVLARQDHNADKRLVAYFSCSADQQQQLDASELRSFLKLRLPDYMIPAAFVQLDSFPLTSNGKIDRAALPAPELVRLDELAYQAPRSEAERILADIWQQVLRIEKVSVTDNFFELGGDSILSIQIIARANQRGLHLTARQMFQHQTVEELAEVAGVNRAVEAEQGRVSGDVPLTPIQRWFFEQEIEDRNHFNQSVLFEVDEEVISDWIEEIVGLLLEHHDALRMRYSPQAGGEWKQTNLVAEHQRVYEYLDLSQIEEGLQRAAIERACEQAQESLNIQSGPMMRVVQMGLGEGRRGRLLIVIHHLVVDGVSWRVLLEEIQSGYEQKQRGEQIRLAAKTTSFKRWAEQMAEQARSEWMREEEGYWKEQASKRVRRLPVDKVGGENTRESARVVSAGLSKEETEELLKGVAETYHTQINEVLMMGLVEAIGEWVGERRVRVEMEGHGREEEIEGADVTRTVGWFTSVYPVVVDVEGVEGVGEELREVKEQMRRIPRKGIGYGMKRYMGGGIEEEEGAEVSFNYLGRFDQVLNKDSWLRGAGEDKGRSMKEGGKRREMIGVVGSVSRGEMRMQWTYSEQVHERETIERVAERYMEALRRIIRESRREETVSYTTSDFPLSKLNQADLDSLLARLGESADEAGS